jgi:non-ribosomal peptide synthetase component F
MAETSCALVRAGRRVAPLSCAQQRLWFIDAAHPGTALYNVPLLLHWRGAVDSEALRAALHAVATRHEVLRTSYQLRDGQPVQVVAGEATVPLEVVDLSGDPGAAATARQDAVNRAREPFDLAGQPLLRCTVWHRPADGDLVLLCMHHIAVDGWSMGILLADLAAAYRATQAGARLELAAPAVQYTDYAVWDQAVTGSPAAQRKLDERASLLRGYPSEVTLGGRAAPRSGTGGYRGAQHLITVPEPLWDASQKLARRLRATPFVVLLAAFEVVVQRWSGHTEFLLGTVMANRPQTELQSLVGMFANTVPLRCTVPTEASFTELCAQVRAEAFLALKHQAIPFDQLVTAVAQQRSVGRSTLVQIGFGLQNAPAGHIGAGTPWSRSVYLPTGTAKFDLTLLLEAVPDGLTGTIEYDLDRYDAQTVHQLGDAFLAVLEAAVAEPDRPVRTLPLTLRPGGELEFVGRADQQVTDQGSRGELTEIQAPVSELLAAQRPAAQLFAEVLAESGLGRAGSPPEALAPDADFFVLGGHSLLAVRMIAKATERFGRAVPLREFLREPTVAGLGRLLETTPAVEVPVTPDPQTWQPAIPVQQRLWFLDRIPQLRSAYLVPVALEYTGPVAAGRLRAAVQFVLGRHPALRSRFQLDRERRAVVYRTDGTPPQVGYVDAGAARWGEAELRDHVAALCWDPFDLSAAVARAEVITVGERTLLVVSAHHIVLDGWSLQLLTAEIGEVYRAAAEARAPRLPAPVHPATVAAPAPEGKPDGLQETLASLQGAPLDIELPHDRPRPAVQPTRGATASLRLGPDLTRRLRARATQHGCTTFAVLVALLAVALARRGSQRDFVFCFPWAGRDVSGRAGAVGMFVNTLFIRVDLSGRPSWTKLLEQVRAASMTSFRNANVSFDAVVAALQPDRDLSRPPITPVIVSLLDAPPVAPDLGPQLCGQFLPMEPLHVKYELAVTAIEHPADLELSIDYPVDLFDHHTITALLAGLQAGALDLVRRPEATMFDPADTRHDPATAAAGEPQRVASEPELVQRIRQAWRDVLGTDSVSIDVSFFETGGDSLLLIMLLDELNTLTGQELTAADLFRYNTVLSQAQLLSGADRREQPTSHRPTDRRRLLGVARRPDQKPVAS